MRSEADSNRCSSFCRAVPSHSAIRPFFNTSSLPPSHSLFGRLHLPHPGPQGCRCRDGESSGVQIYKQFAIPQNLPEIIRIAPCCRTAKAPPLLPRHSATAPRQCHVHGTTRRRTAQSCTPCGSGARHEKSGPRTSCRLRAGLYDALNIKLLQFKLLIFDATHSNRIVAAVGRILRVAHAAGRRGHDSETYDLVRRIDIRAPE